MYLHQNIADTSTVILSVISMFIEPEPTQQHTRAGKLSTRVRLVILASFCTVGGPDSTLFIFLIPLKEVMRYPRVLKN